MHSEVESLCQRLRNYRPPSADRYGYPPGQEPREHHVICDEAAALIERLYREREKLREALKPFAQVADEFLPDDQDDFSYGHLSYGDFRRARAALAEQPQ
jgi:hypothetical protein